MATGRIKGLRIQRAWSQEQLAEAAGISVRTVQRIENGATPGLETLKALAAVFEMDVAELAAEQSNPLHEEPNMNNGQTLEQQPSNRKCDASEPQAFYQMAARFAVILAFLLAVNLFTSPDYLWVKWPALGMGMAIAFRALFVFGGVDSRKD